MYHKIVAPVGGIATAGIAGARAGILGSWWLWLVVAVGAGVAGTLAVWALIPRHNRDSSGQP